MTAVPDLLQAAMNAINSGIILFATDGRVCFWNRWMADYARLSVEEVQGRLLQQVFPQESLSRLLQGIDSALSRGMTSVISHSLHRSPLPLFAPTGDGGGERIEQSILIRPLDTPGMARHCLLQVTDVSPGVRRERILRQQGEELRRLAERREANELELRAALAQAFQERELAQVALASITDAVLTTDAEGLVTFINPAGRSLIGQHERPIDGRPLLEVLQFQDSLTQQQAAVALRMTLRDGTINQLVDGAVLESAKGDVAVDTFVSPLRSLERQIIGSVTVLQDVSERRRMHERLTYQATHDELTGLINRRELARRLDEALQLAAIDNLPSVLLFMDLDQFKIVNDTCGHQAGDELLKLLTAQLSDSLRNIDTLARLGGDEFAILLHGCNEEAGLRIAEQLREVVHEFRFHWIDRIFRIGASFGMVMIDDSWRNAAGLMSAADSACYLAKEGGRNRVVVYRQEGENEQRQRGEMEWASRIRVALERNDFVLYCQPIVGIHCDTVASLGCEVLVRMLDREGNIVPPLAFIPAAERFDLMSYVDRWVLEQVVRYWSEQPQLFEQLARCTINLSGQSLGSPDFFDYMNHLLQRADIPWHKVCFEITETAMVSNLDNAKALIGLLHAHGCRFALDDFGSGLSSFAYLKHLAVHYLKIDGAFVRDILHDPIDAAMIRSICDIGRAMELQTIAEFVESGEVIGELQRSGVHYAQGYGICRPFPLLDLGSMPAMPVWESVAQALRQQ